MAESKIKTRPPSCSDSSEAPDSPNVDAIPNDAALLRLARILGEIANSTARKHQGGTHGQAA